MKPTIADILIQNFDQNNYATDSLVKGKMNSIKWKKEFRKLKNWELEKLAIQKLKKGELINIKPKRLEKDSEEYKLKRKEYDKKYKQSQKYKTTQKESRFKYYLKNREKIK